MDHVAIQELEHRYMQTVRAAETYRDAAEMIETFRDFYHALAVTYERRARDARNAGVVRQACDYFRQIAKALRELPAEQRKLRLNLMSDAERQSVRAMYRDLFGEDV